MVEPDPERPWIPRVIEVWASGTSFPVATIDTNGAAEDFHVPW
jgi:hypothetical protein